MSSKSTPSTLVTETIMTENIKNFFTEDEWDAIYAALADYQDHGSDETEIAYQIQSKISALFN